jgi:secreted trypsin-like serine protease
MLRSFLLLTLVSLFSGSLRAIVVVSGDGSSAVVSLNQTVNGVNLNGVVELDSSAGIRCSGSLLSDGYSILTAGHCITSSYGSAVPGYVYVSFPGDSTPYKVTTYYVDPLWTGDSGQGNDLAILRLDQAAPSSAVGYSLFTGFYDGSPILLAGYGQTGNGTTGNNGGSGTLRQGQNRYDTTGSDPRLGWSANMLVGDFDNGTETNNALGSTDSDITNEVDLGKGDSGGPSFFDGEIIGVHDLGACFSLTESGPCLVPPDGPSLSTVDNSYFGQLFADTSVGASASWIESEEETPEPASCSMVLLGLAVAGFFARRSGRRPA